MAELNLVYDPQGGKNQSLHPTQGEVYKSQKRFKTVRCGRGWGKTAYCIAEIAKEAKIPNSVIWYVGLTVALGKEQMWDRLCGMFPKEFIASVNKSTLCITLVNGTKIYIKGANNIHGATNLRGRRINLVVFDEAAFMGEDVWGKILQSAVRRATGRAIFLSTPNGYNWFKKLCETDHTDWAHFHYTTYDNPYYPKEEIDAQRDPSKTEQEDLSFRQEVLAEFLKEMGVVYQFTMEDNLTRNSFSGGKWFIGIDTGANDFTGVTWWRRTGGVYVSEYEYNNNTNSLPKHIEIIKDISKRLGCIDNNGNWVNTTLVIDQTTNKTELTSGSSVFRDFRRSGIPVMPSDKDMQLSVSCVKSLIESKRLFVKPVCVSLINAFKIWENGKHEPDILAAARYALRFAELHEAETQIAEKIPVDTIVKNATIGYTGSIMLSFRFGERNV